MMPSLFSPVVDSGVANGLTTDQRGEPRTVDVPNVPDATGSDGTDIGAVEYTDVAVKGASLSAKKKQKVKKKVVVKLEVGTGQELDVLASGTIKAKKKQYPLTPVEVGLDAESTQTLSLKPAAKASKKLKKLFKKGKRAKANLSVIFTNDAGVTQTETAKVTLKGKKKRKKKK